MTNIGHISAQASPLYRTFNFLQEKDKSQLSELTPALLPGKPLPHYKEQARLDQNYHKWLPPTLDNAVVELDKIIKKKKAELPLDFDLTLTLHKDDDKLFLVGWAATTIRGEPEGACIVFGVEDNDIKKLDENTDLNALASALENAEVVACSKTAYYRMSKNKKTQLIT